MEFLSSVNGLGTVPLLILIVVIFILLLREIKRENASLASSFDRHKQALDKSIDEYRAAVDRQIEAQNVLLEKMDARLRTVEKDYAEKTYVQEAMSGWRQEIRSLNDKIDKLVMGGCGNAKG